WTPELIGDVTAPDHGLDLEVYGRRAENDPLRGREIPHQLTRIRRERHAGFGHSAPQAREPARGHREGHRTARELPALTARLSESNAEKGCVFGTHRANHGDTLLSSAFAYRPRMTTSSGASSTARSRTAPCRRAPSSTWPSVVISSAISSSVR